MSEGLHYIDFINLELRKYLAENDAYESVE